MRFPALFRSTARLLQSWYRDTDSNRRLETQILKVDEYITFRGNMYGQRLRQQRNVPWVSTVDREVDMTVTAIESAQRTVPDLLPVGWPSLEASQSGHPVRLEDMDAAAMSHEVWSEMGFDEVLCDLLTRCYGPTCTKLQARVLPALLGGTCDVLSSGATGSGKTVALVAAMLQGIRNEDAGLNVFLCSNSFLCRQVYSMVHTLLGPVGGNICSPYTSKDPFAWLTFCPYVDHAPALAQELRRLSSYRYGSGVRMLITTPDVLNDVIFKNFDIVSMKEVGKLRRVYIDDVGPQISFPRADATISELKERDENPTALEVCIGHIHQKLSAPSRSMCQFGLVSADMESRLVRHLDALCLNPYHTERILAVTRLPATLRLHFCYVRHRAAHEVAVHLAMRISIAGRAILFAQANEDVLLRRTQLRRLGMDVHLLCELEEKANAAGCSIDHVPWKFLLLRECEGHGLDFTAVSHLFLLVVPENRYSLLHMVGRTARLNRIGHAFCIWPAATAQATADMVRELNVEVKDHLVDEWELTANNSTSYSSTGSAGGGGGRNGTGSSQVCTDPLEPWGLDPRFVVREKYLEEDNPEARAMKRLQWRGKFTIYMEEDYTPAWKRRRTLLTTKRLVRHLRQRPEDYVHMFKDEYIRPDLRPTDKLKKTLHMDDSDRTEDTSEMDALASQVGLRSK